MLGPPSRQAFALRHLSLRSMLPIGPSSAECPLLGVKRTSLVALHMSAFDPKREVSFACHKAVWRANSQKLVIYFRPGDGKRVLWRFLQGGVSMKPCLNTVFAAGMLAFGCITSASATSVIYDGGAPDQGGQIFSFVAQTFTLAPGGTVVTGANWWGGCFPATTCSGSSFQLTIWSDNSGQLGSILNSIPVGGANETATGNLIGGAGGWNEYAYTTTFAPISLTAGTTYWFGIDQTAAESLGRRNDEHCAGRPEARGDSRRGNSKL